MALVRCKAALRVDPLLSGNWEAVKGALVEAGYETTIEGAKQFLRDWAKAPPPLRAPWLRYWG
jgi:hypothetical protein